MSVLECQEEASGDLKRVQHDDCSLTELLGIMLFFCQNEQMTSV